MIAQSRAELIHEAVQLLQRVQLDEFAAFCAWQAATHIDHSKSKVVECALAAGARAQQVWDCRLLGMKRRLARSCASRATDTAWESAVEDNHRARELGHAVRDAQLAKLDELRERKNH